MRSIVFLLIVGTTNSASAWNSLGHKVVAEIAWRQIEPEQRKAIVEVLRRHPRFDSDFAEKMDDNALIGDKSNEDHWIFQQAATWPDVIRKNKEYDQPRWHYIDLPQFLNSSDKQACAGKLQVNISTDYPTTLPRDQYNILQALAHCETAIKSNAGPDVKAIAYCWLFHLVGDIHQPLHCSALFNAERFPKGDKGGNEIPMKRGKNLHSLWDNLLGRDSYIRSVDKAVMELSDRNRFADVWENAANETDARKWATESHAMCESVVYDPAILETVKHAPTGDRLAPIDLPEEYYRTAGEQARRRIIEAGIRLAQILKSFSEPAKVGGKR